MARHTIQITNGKGSIELVDGTYMAQGVAGGYDASTFSPKSVTIVSGTDTYAFTIGANGTLTLHVTDTGNPDSGIAVVGAKFVRTDSTGNIIGNEVISNQEGNAIFNNVPFAPSGSNAIYYKQIAGDGGHTFDATVKSIVMTEENQTVQVTNPNAPVRNFTLMDASYANIPIIDGQIILED